MSMVGGGVYNWNGKLYFGFGIGVNRILDLCEEDKYLHQKFIKRTQAIHILYKGQVPDNILSELEKRGKQYIINPFQNIRKQMSLIKGRELDITHTCIISEEQDHNKEYFHKVKDGVVKRYSLSQYVDLLCSKDYRKNLPGKLADTSIW